MAEQSAAAAVAQHGQPDIVSKRDFLKLVTNNASGPMLFLRGRLKIDGDLMLASRLTGLFRIPGT